VIHHVELYSFAKQRRSTTRLGNISMSKARVCRRQHFEAVLIFNASKRASALADVTAYVHGRAHSDRRHLATRQFRNIQNQTFVQSIQFSQLQYVIG